MPWMPETSLHLPAISLLDLEMGRDIEFLVTSSAHWSLVRCRGPLLTTCVDGGRWTVDGAKCCRHTPPLCRNVPWKKPRGDQEVTQNQEPVSLALILQHPKRPLPTHPTSPVTDHVRSICAGCMTRCIRERYLTRGRASVALHGPPYTIPYHTTRPSAGHAPPATTRLRAPTGLSFCSFFSSAIPSSRQIPPSTSNPVLSRTCFRLEKQDSNEDLTLTCCSTINATGIYLD